MQQKIKKLFKIFTLLGLIVSLITLALFFVYSRYLYQEKSALVFTKATERELNWQAPRYPSLSFIWDSIRFFHVENPAHIFSQISTADVVRNILTSPARNLGPSPQRTSLFQKPSVLKPSREIHVSTEKEFFTALKKAKAGDNIILSSGSYYFKTGSFPLSALGTKKSPITIKAQKLGDVTFKMNMLEGFHIRGAYWRVENLILEGTCEIDDYCEHAFHITGKGQGAVIRNNIVKNFNSHVKINASGSESPNKGLIEHNIFFNDAPRQTSNSVTLIDALVTDDWIVRNNIIADFAKAQGNHISYAAFFKGAGRRNIFEKNLVICEWKHRGGTRVGLSFGGGGTGEKYCPNNDCSTEHFGGIIRNNIIMNCPREVGIYLNRSYETNIHNNLLYNTHGIDVRFDTSTAQIFNNIIDGRIRSRNGGFYMEEKNILSFISAVKLESLAENLYINIKAGNFIPQNKAALKHKGVTSRSLADDICGNQHETFESAIGPFNLKDNDPCQMNFKFIQDYIK
jgi:hypothetical protein